MKRSRKKHSWFNYRIGSLLIIIALIGVIFSTCTNMFQTNSKSMSALERLTPGCKTNVPWNVEDGLDSVQFSTHFKDGVVSYRLTPASKFDTFLSRLFGKPLNSEVSEILATRTSFGDSEMLEVSKMHSLKVLKLENTRITDVGIRSLHKLALLREIYVDDSNSLVSDDVLDEFVRRRPNCKIYRKNLLQGVIGN